MFLGYPTLEDELLLSLHADAFYVERWWKWESYA